MYDRQEELDNLVWDKTDEDWEVSFKKMRLKTTCRQVEQLAERKFGQPAILVSMIVGGFNVLYRIRLERSSPDVLVRLPASGLVLFPDEKTIQEAATAEYVRDHTQVPIPRHFFSGKDGILGSFIILQYVEGCRSMSARLTTPDDNPSKTHVLNSDISETVLEDLWSKAARCLLQLSRLTFPRIGALVKMDGGSYDIAGRPITHNMTDMVRLANIPCTVLPQEGKTYGTADEWYVALAEMHLAQLVFQRNDLVSSEDDCRNKYVARQIFRRLAKQGRLSTFGFAEDNWSAQSSRIEPSTLSPAPAGSNLFSLWGDDWRAGNWLVNESDHITAMLDWEFTYAAPTQFILDPPWWLLLDLAETWSSGIDNWKKVYEVRLKTWLSAMKRAESVEELGSLPAPLSTYMQQSWETGRFWLSYGARKSWAFDAVYWKFLDERFFGDRRSDVPKCDLWKSRVHLLTAEEREAMEPFVTVKMNESKERVMVSWDPAEARQRLSQVLFD
ncbi:Protein kinase-like domain [Pleurostoma richardsiae]|uniref:Protein kinase-like domain n=1 Tax=Pleurostoma richardsiae TaxID=41990 RepID=A0AA38R541_9PEZI|nr:Protein kinase-like domain [Pleurostoma richardsiae]